jgi:hypothetical protein
VTKVIGPNAIPRSTTNPIRRMQLPIGSAALEEKVVPVMKDGGISICSITLNKIHLHLPEEAL